MNGSPILQTCPHNGTFHRIQTETRTVTLCPSCHDAIMSRLSNRRWLASMIKSTLPAAEFQRIRAERRAMEAGAEVRDSVSAAWAVAGFPQNLALPAPEVG